MYTQDNTSTGEAAPSHRTTLPSYAERIAAEAEFARKRNERKQAEHNESTTPWGEASDAEKRARCYDFIETKLRGPDAPKASGFFARAIHHLKDLTDRYALALVGGKHRVVDLEADTFETMSLESFRAMHGNVRFTIHNAEGVPTPNEMTAAELWFQFPWRRNYHKVTLKPPVHGDQPWILPDELNLWKPPAILGSGGSYNLLREHLEENVCQADPERFEFVTTWFADIVQNPGRKTGSVLILRGEEGTGKSIVGQAFCRMIGPRHSIVLSQESQIVGNFNSHLAMPVFVLAEEAVFAGSKSFGALKQLVTGEMLAVEMKGVDVVQMPNFSRIMMCSNERWVVPASAGSRRWFVTDVCADRKGDFDFFRRLREQLDDGGLGSWQADLMAWKIDEDLLRNPPNTWELEQQRLDSMDHPGQFFIDLLKEGPVDFFPQGNNAGTDYPIASEFIEDLFPRFEEAMLKRGARFAANRTAMKQAMGDVLGLHPRQKKVDGTNARRFAVPPLDELRKEVAERLKLNLDDLME
jgi:hypothetical protein